MAAVTAHDREAWLACYADDAVLFDPVGGSPLDPEGTGLRGREALTSFWALMVEPNEVRFDIQAVHAAGMEAAVIATASMRFATGQSVSYDGVFVYSVDAAGEITMVRAYFDLQAVLATLAASTTVSA